MKSNPLWQETVHAGSDPKSWQANAPLAGGSYIGQVFSVKKRLFEVRLCCNCYFVTDKELFFS